MEFPYKMWAKSVFIRKTFVVPFLHKMLRKNTQNVENIFSAFFVYLRNILCKMVQTLVFLINTHFLLKFCKENPQISVENPQFPLKLPKSGIKKKLQYSVCRLPYKTPKGHTAVCDV